MANICLLVLIATQMHRSLSSGQSVLTEVGNGVPFQGELNRAQPGLPPVKRLATESALTEAEKQAFLAKHNELRGQTDPPAANMEYMVWDDRLATHAQRYSDMCVWAHGFPKENITPFNLVGQNLWFAGPVSVNYRLRPEGIIQGFFNERDHYDYDTNTCKDGEQCGHYTQVVWHDSYALGCGVTFCPTASETTAKNIMLVSCHYGNAGNYAGERPYTSGTPCTKCRSRIGQCYLNKCLCAQVCENCSTLDDSACKCNCFWGYNLADCSARCIDDSRCGNQWPYSWCDTYKYVRDNCPAMCGDCNEYLPQFFQCEDDTLIA